jgi:hypothetical protein
MLRFERPQPGSLERRRFPHGRHVCQGELKPWHLNLERLRRELDLTRDEHVKLQLQSELEDILMQHVRPSHSSLEQSALISSLETHPPQRTQPIEETA